MRIADFEALVNRLEKPAFQNPRAFRFKVSAYIAFGYLLMFLVLLGIFVVAIALGFVRLFSYAVRLLTFGGHFARGMIRGLSWRFDPPDGIKLDRGLGAPLYATVDEVCEKLNAPKIHAIYIIEDFNASAMQIPRLGPLGKYDNVVSIGLPLLAVLALDEVRGVIAHEIGHIHRGHSRFSIKVGRISTAWSEALKQIEKQRLKAGFIRDIFARYSPWLSAARHVLSRLGENEANRAEEQIAGRQVSAQALGDLAIYSAGWHDTFSDVAVATYEADQIPEDFLMRYYRAMQEPIEGEIMVGRIRKRLDAPYDPFSSHPTMSRLLADLGYDPKFEKVMEVISLPTPERESAGVALFGPKVDLFVSTISKMWTAKNAQRWSENKARYVEGAAERDALLEEINEGPESDADRIDLAIKLRRYQKYEEAKAMVEPVKDLNSLSRMAYGMILRDLDDPGWVPWVERAAEDPAHRDAACDVLIRYFTSTGEREKVQHFIEMARDQRKADAEAETQFLRLTDYWIHIPTAWTEEEIRRTVEVMEANKKVRRLYIVDRKSPDGLHQNTCIVAEYGGGLVDPDRMVKELVKAPYPHRCAIFVRKDAPNYVTAVSGALVYDRKLDGKK